VRCSGAGNGACATTSRTAAFAASAFDTSAFAADKASSWAISASSCASSSIFSAPSPDAPSVAES
jgi:hypothetical protein